MKNYEALELQAKAMRLVEGTELEWSFAVKFRGASIIGIHLPNDVNNYELALAIVEGKPVFVGDVLYISTRDDANYGTPLTVTNNWGVHSGWSEMTWVPPKPRTVLVELLVEDAVNYGEKPEWMLEQESIRISAACRKALEAL